MGKSTAIAQSSFIVPTRRLDWCSVPTDVERFALEAYAGSPFSATTIPRHALEAAAISSQKTHVAHVFSVGAYSKIFFPVVKAIEVYVIHLHPLWGSHDIGMHVNDSPSNSSDGVKSIRFKRGGPIRSTDSLVIRNIDFCRLALCEGDKPVIKWLHNCVTDYIFVCHSLYHRATA